jgi:hypothetical protein
MAGANILSFVPPHAGRVRYAVLHSKVKLGMCELKDILDNSRLPFGHIDGPVDGPAAEENNMRAITMVGDRGTGTAAPSELHIGMEREISTSRCWNGGASTLLTLIPMRLHTRESNRANHCHGDDNYDNTKHNRGPGGDAHVEGAGHTHRLIATSADDGAYQEGDERDRDHDSGVCGKEDETPVLSGRSSSSGEAHIYGSSCAFNASARTSFRGVEKDKSETSDEGADKNCQLKLGKITSPTSILGKCCKGVESFLLGTVYLLSGSKDAVFNVDSRRAVDSSKGLGNSGVKMICLCLTLDTLFAAILFLIVAEVFKAEGGLKGKSERRHRKVQGRWGKRGEKRSRTRHPKSGSPFKGIANIRGFNLAFFLFLLIAGVSGVSVDNMNALFNTVSFNGNSNMANGDTTILAVGSYKCSEGTCSGSDDMLDTFDLNGEVKCVEDNASCVLDGENQRGGMYVEGTGGGTLILRALTFDKGYAEYGGGVYIFYGALVDLELCIFSNNRATDSSFGGGAIFVDGSGTSSGTRVNIYGTSFNVNTALYGGNGDDIYNNAGIITIHITCPSPYSSNTPIQGKTKMRIV